jgi:hypothetical protein
LTIRAQLSAPSADRTSPSARITKRAREFRVTSAPLSSLLYGDRRAQGATGHPREEDAMAKGIEKLKKDNKPKLSTKEKQKKKKEKQAAK